MPGNPYENDVELIKSAIVNAIIPEDNETAVSELVQQDHLFEDGNQGDPNLQIKERNVLFFDECLRVLVTLKLPQCNEEVLKSCLKRLEFRVEIFIEETTPRLPAEGSENVSAADLIFSGIVPKIEDPIVLLSQISDDTAEEKALILVWELQCTLGRPRIRISDPVATLRIATAIASSKPSSTHLGQSYLSPFQPEEENILEPMRHIPGFEDDPPYLAASRLERIIPELRPNDQSYHRENFTEQKYKIVPAAIPRMRHVKAPDLSANSMTVAALDVEIIPYIEIKGFIQVVDISIANGRSESVMLSFLPMDFQSGDYLTFLFLLHSPKNQALSYKAPGNPQIFSSNPNVDVLTINIRLAIRLNETHLAHIKMNWTTNIDLSQTINPAFGTPSQTIQRQNKPSKLPFGDENSKSITSFNSSLQPVNPNVTGFRGLTISFTSPNEPVKLGELFNWKVMVVNRSALAAKLAIIPLVRAQRPTTQAQYLAKRHAPKSSTASSHPNEKRPTRNGQEVDIAQAVVDENVVYAMQHSNAMPSETDLISLTAELRIGPLAPGQCHESEITMLAFETGTLRADAIRVVDLLKETEDGNPVPGAVIDIRELPDIIVVK